MDLVVQEGRDNMNEEEKKAIKDFKHTLENPDTKFWIGTNGIKNIDIILKLIEKLQEEIKKYKYYMVLICETCIDESKCHITSQEAIQEIRKYIYVERIINSKE